MSDEWIEHRSLRGRRPPPIEPLDLSEPVDLEEDFVPRFITSTGELQPLTDETIAMIEEMIKAKEQGKSLPPAQPLIEVETGRFEPISRQTLDELAENVREHSRRRKKHAATPPAPAEPPHWDTLAGVHPIKDDGPGKPPIPDDYLPWFETSPGGLPPIIDEPSDDEDEGEEKRVETVEGEVVEAEWVKELDAEVADPTIPSTGKIRRPGPVTQQLLQAVKEGNLGGEGVTTPQITRWTRRAIVTLLIVTAVIITNLFVPGFLDLTGNSTPEPEVVIETPQEEAAAPLEATSTPQPTPLPEPSATLLPHQQGRIAFASSSDGDFDIYVLDMITGDVTVLTTNDSADRSPAWSPDGSRIAFVSDRNGDDDLFVMNADGSNQIQLTTSTALDHSPDWSPDGQLVMFSRETTGAAELLVFPTDCMTTPGACEDNLSAITTGRYDLDPTYSPDGTRIAYASASTPGVQPEIGIAGVAGDNVATLPGTDAADSYPAWSPDGTQLAFISNVFGDHDLWITFVPADASTGDPGSTIQITRQESGDVQPDWSPDGQFLLFASDRGDGGDFDLYIVASDCMVSSVLTCDEAAEIIFDNDGDDLDPAWGP